MKVTLIDATGHGRADAADYAATILIFTKHTRLNMTPGLFGEIQAWSQEKKINELRYMASSVPSSWEFCDYTWLIEGVGRGFTHQLVRTRQASFAQQSMRVVNMEDFDYVTPTGAKTSQRYHHAMRLAQLAYKSLLDEGLPMEDARGVLPTNIATSIMVKLNMRNFVMMVRKRTSPRVQDEYHEVLNAMQATALAEHPWLELFINNDADQATKTLYKMFGELPKDAALLMTKQLDIIRGQE